MSIRGIWKIWQLKDDSLQFAYHGSIGALPVNWLPTKQWAIAVPDGGWLRQPFLLEPSGVPSRQWKLASRKKDEMLDVTDSCGITVERTIPWFLKFLELNFDYHPDYGPTNASWLDALDGLWILQQDQRRTITRQEEEFTLLKRSAESLVKDRNRLLDEREEAYRQEVRLNEDRDRLRLENKQLRAQEDRFRGEIGRLASAIYVAIEALFATKRFGKHGGQASKAAMSIRKKLFAVYEEVVGEDHPCTMQLAKLQGIRERPTARTGDEAVQKVR